jgi:hypothetical protein
MGMWMAISFDRFSLSQLAGLYSSQLVAVGMSEDLEKLDSSVRSDMTSTRKASPSVSCSARPKRVARGDQKSLFEPMNS